MKLKASNKSKLSDSKIIGRIIGGWFLIARLLVSHRRQDQAAAKVLWSCYSVKYINQAMSNPILD